MVYKHNKYWLKIRGLDTTSNAGELKQHLIHEKKKDQPAEILPKPSITPKDIIEFMTLWHTVLCNIMARTTTKEHCEKTHLSILLFLNKFTEIDYEIDKFGEKKKDLKNEPAWQRNFNVICLLNCASDMLRWGPVRGRWEGGSMGEKVIQLLKGEFIGFIKDWPMHLIKRYYETKSLGMIRNGIEKQQINKNLSKHHHIYSSSIIIENELTQKKPIYMIQKKDSTKLRIGTIQHGNYFWEMKLTYILDINDTSWYTIACQPEVSKDNIIDSTEIVRVF